MYRRLGINVVEGNDFVVFVHDITWNFSGRNSTKQAI